MAVDSLLTSAQLRLFGTILRMTAREPRAHRVCQEKAQLLEAYVKATEEYLDSLTVLSVSLVRDKVEYNRIRDLSESYRMKSEQARLAFESHTATHGC